MPLAPTHIALAALALVGLAALAAALWVARAYSKRPFKDVEQTWRRYAASKQMRYRPAPLLGRYLLGAGPSIETDVQGVEVTLFGDTSGPSTRVSATLPGVSGDFLLTIRRRSLGGDGGVVPAEADAAIKLEEAPTGNKSFDAQFALLSNEPDLARSLLDRRLAQVVGGFPRELSSISTERNRLVLAWSGMEKDPEVLDAAIQVVFTACRRRA